MQSKDKYNTDFEKFKNRLNGLNIVLPGVKGKGNIAQKKEIYKEIENAIKNKDWKQLAYINIKIDLLPISEDEKDELKSIVRNIKSNIEKDERMENTALENARKIFGNDIEVEL